MKEQREIALQLTRSDLANLLGLEDDVELTQISVSSQGIDVSLLL